MNLQIKSEECLDINRLLFSTSDESSFSVGTSELPCDINIQDIISNHKIHKDSINMHNIRNNYKRNSENINDELLSSVNVGSYTNSVDEDFYNTKIDQPNKLNDINMNDSALNIETYSDTVYNNVLWNITDENSIMAKFETPDSSKSPITIMETRTAVPLTLDFQSIQFVSDEINTPNIIDSIIAQEKLDFGNTSNNIAEEVIEATIPLDATPPASVSAPVVKYTGIYADLSVSEQSVMEDLNLQNIPNTNKLSRKRKFQDADYDYNTSDDDDDEEYIPPSKSSRSASRKVSSRESTPFKVAKRGRPPKRNNSVSSDDYSQLDPNEARYREMRDRNNEASRKSRFKRKQKEVDMGKELTDLEHENIKLKTQVDELQKTVDNYRDSLMKVMLNKK